MSVSTYQRSAASSTYGNQAFHRINARENKPNFPCIKETPPKTNTTCNSAEYDDAHDDSGWGLSNLSLYPRRISMEAEGSGSDRCTNGATPGSDSMYTNRAIMASDSMYAYKDGAIPADMYSSRNGDLQGPALMYSYMSGMRRLDSMHTDTLLGLTHDTVPLPKKLSTPLPSHGRESKLSYQADVNENDRKGKESFAQINIPPDSSMPHRFRQGQISSSIIDIVRPKCRTVGLISLECNEMPSNASNPMVLNTSPLIMCNEGSRYKSSYGSFMLDVVDEDEPLASGTLPLEVDPLPEMWGTMSESGTCSDAKLDSDSDSDADADSTNSVLTTKNDNNASSVVHGGIECSTSMGCMEDQISSNGHSRPLEYSSSVGMTSSPCPRKVGLSRFYSGKSRSFSFLGDVDSLRDIIKPENPYAKKRKYNNSTISSFDQSSLLHPSQTYDASVSRKSSPGNGGKKYQRCMVGSRSYSFPDLQGVSGTQRSPES